MSIRLDYSVNEPSRDEINKLSGPTLLEFGNSWCGFCRRAEPLIEDALRDRPGIRHIRIADASGKRLGRSFRVKLWPTFIFLKDGEELARLVRPVEASDVRRAVETIDG